MSQSIIRGPLRSLASVMVPGLVRTAAIMSVAILGALVATSSETMLRTSFTSALDTAAPDTTLAVSKTAPIAGSEDYWLSAMRQDGHGGPLTKTVAIGDQISLSLGGERRTLEVASVSEFTPQVTEIDTNPAASRFVLVTARDKTNDASSPIRFVMEIGHAADTVTSRVRDRAL